MSSLGIKLAASRYLFLFDIYIFVPLYVLFFSSLVVRGKVVSLWIEGASVYKRSWMWQDVDDYNSSLEKLEQSYISLFLSVEEY